MGDFVGGMLKYLRTHPGPLVTIAGGVGKMTKLAQGLTDLHSKRGAVDHARLAEFARAAGGSKELCTRIVSADNAAEVFALAQSEGIGLGHEVARAAQRTAARAVEGRDIARREHPVRHARRYRGNGRRRADRAHGAHPRRPRARR